MIGDKHSFEILKSGLKYAQSRKPDYVEFLLLSWDSSLTRTANSQIHQNVAETEAGLAVEIIHNLRIGSASTNLLTEQSIRKAIDVALESTRHKAQLPGPLKLETFSTGAHKGRFFDKTAGFSPQERATIIKTIIDKAKASHLITSAKFQTGSGEIAVANSLGTLAYTCFTDANLSVILTGPNDSSYSAIASPDVGALEVETLADQLIARCRLQNQPGRDLFAGKQAGDEVFYDVILESAAVAEWLEFLSYTGFNGLSYHEEESFLCGKLGQKVMKENITIWDDGNDPTGYVLPFDFEGTPKSKVYFIEKGIGRNVAYDGF